MRRVRASQLAVVAGYVVAALAFTWPLPLHLSTHLLGEAGGDTGVYVWNQWVFHQELTSASNPLTTERILSLTRRVDLSQHNYTAFLDLLAFPLIPLVGVVATFNLVYLAVAVLNGLMAYGLARRATSAPRAEAWLAGAAFAWAPVLVARSTGHFSLVAAAPLAAFLWALVNAERSRSVRDAAIVGLCMAWAAFCDAYFGVYCLMIAGLYIATTAVRVTRSERAVARPWRWLVDVLLVCVAGLVIGMLMGRRGAFTFLGIRVSVREFYTPMLALTVLATLRAAMAWRPRLIEVARPRPWVLKLGLVGVLACAGPLSPVLLGLGQRIVDGRFVSPPTFWRSSPRGADLLAFFSPNPNHPLVKLVAGDGQAAAPTVFVEYTVSFSLVALAVVAFAAWRAGYRPRRGWWWMTAAFAALALGPFVYLAGVNTHIPGPWALLRYVPPMSLARMPSRFAIVAALGLAVLLAGALAAIGTRWPERRRLVVGLVGALLVFELWPAPRTLYSASISPIYDVIAADPRPVRVLTLPFGVRDGVSSAGNFRARSQFSQTRHGKPLIGGYLSRISRHRVNGMQQDFPTLAALIKLSEDRPLDAGVARILAERGDRLVRKANIGYVVIDSRFIPDERTRMVIEAFRLRERQRDGYLGLYVPEN